MDNSHLEGRRAVITGGARGMGYAIAKRFLEKGAAVALWDLDEARLAQAADSLSSTGKVSYHKVDVSSFDNVEAAAKQAQQTLGGVELLVNAAGLAGATAPVTDYPNDVWHKVMDVNLNGIFYCCKTIVPMMQSANYGRIVNIASIAGKEGNPNASAYSASKAGLIGFTKSLGKELATSNISVNVICPAVVDTEMLKDVKDSHIEYMLSKIPMGRMGSVDEIANLVEFLSSEGCSYSTGAVYDLSGGRATY